jgi:hypothetical protein
MSGTTNDGYSSTKLLIDSAKQSFDFFLAFYRQAAKFGLDGVAMWREAVGDVVPAAKAPAEAVTGVFDQWATAAFEIVGRAVRIQQELATDAVEALHARR